MGRNTAAAAAAIGEPTAEAVAASLPGAAMDRETLAPASAAGTGTAPTVWLVARSLAAPTSEPFFSHAPGLPSFFRSISLDAFKNLSSSASLTNPPTRPM